MRLCKIPQVTLLCSKGWESLDSGLLLPAPQSSQTHVMGSIQDREWLSTSSAPAFFSLLLGLLWPGRRKEWAEAGGQNKAEAEPSPPGCSLCLVPPDLLTQGLQWQGLRTGWHQESLIKAKHCAGGEHRTHPATLEFSWFWNTALTLTGLGLCLCYALRLKCPLKPTLFFPGVEFCLFLKAKLCEFLPDLLLLRQEDSLPPHRQQEFVPRIKAALHALCHLGRCLPADLVGRPQRQSCPHSLQHSHASHDWPSSRRAQDLESNRTVSDPSSDRIGPIAWETTQPLATSYTVQKCRIPGLTPRICI